MSRDEDAARKNLEWMNTAVSGCSGEHLAAAVNRCAVDLGEAFKEIDRLRNDADSGQLEEELRDARDELKERLEQIQELEYQLKDAEYR